MVTIKQFKLGKSKQYIDSPDEAPEDVQVYESDENPGVYFYYTEDHDEEPERDETFFEDFTDGSIHSAVDSLVSDSTRSGKNTNYFNQPLWSNFLDSLTQQELRDSFLQTIHSTNDNHDTSPNLLEHEERKFEGDRRNPSNIEIKGIGAVVSRMDNDNLLDSVERAIHDIEEVYTSDDLTDMVEQKMFQSVAYFGGDGDFIYEFEDEFGNRDSFNEIERDIPGSTNEYSILTETDNEKWLESWIEDWAMYAMSSGALLTQSALGEYRVNDDDNSIVWAEGYPLDEVEVTENMREKIDMVYERTQEYYDNNEKKLYRGVSNKVTTHNNIESWTEDREVAESFDGHEVLEANVDVGDVLATWESLGGDDEDGYWPEGHVQGEKEWMVLGGCFHE